MTETKSNPWALLPLFIFLALFIGSGVITGDFYKLPVVVAILIASAVALVMNRKDSLTVKMERFAKGAGHPDIMIMVFIYILAGAFAETAKGMGAVESTVNLALTVIPQNLLIVGLFVIGVFISLAMGTSMGTITALAPIGVGISHQIDVNIALCMAAIVGGAMFGDNLSVISDTTIAAVRTQKTKMTDKFKMNFLIVLPAAIITCVILFFVASGSNAPIDVKDYNWIKIIPYIGVLVAALFGLNVLVILSAGIVLAGGIGLVDGSYTVSSLFQKMTAGIFGMSELIILALLIGGMVELINHNGGIKYLLDALTRKIRSPKGAQLGIAGLVSATDLATANNTISIITVGPLAKKISDQYGIDNRKSASILDIFACSMQGLIPYGAQLLTVAKFASISPISVLPYSFYPILIAICGLISIFVGYPRLKPSTNKNGI
ncbi:Na+/H+ antiporter NhaC family protein [Priestia koreensis]|uniref:Sodium:proton antiporter n=1 Tax=Priestia koreensis TaxID=284581 RepID=A0A0M0L7L3_9BACI|nr:Na+/H+ antiporter NhaC family protein [Priestia koreensis]KOO47081.1 sodium:proton antiporter [Priestia koreensis]